MILFLAIALGLVIIGQTVSLLSRVGATEFLGTVMATVVVRELGPLLTALIVLVGGHGERGGVGDGARAR